MRRLQLSRWVFLLVGAILTAGPRDARAEDTDPVVPKFGRLVRAETWLKQPVRDVDGKDFGSVRDLALDLETGHVALTVVGDSKDGREEFLVIPPRLLKEDRSRRLTLLRNADGPRLAVADLEESLQRGFAGARYRAFGEEPYWSLPKIGEKVSAGEIPKWDEHYRLTLLSKLSGTKVVDKNGHPLGPLMGFAFSPKSGQIVYAAIRLDENDSDRHLAIPLSAFVVPSEDSGSPATWQIELSSEIVQDTPGFDARHWPTELERGWIEYVHVRYGRSPLGGVRHTTKAQRDKEAARTGDAPLR